MTVLVVETQAIEKGDHGPNMGNFLAFVISKDGLRYYGNNCTKQEKFRKK